MFAKVLNRVSGIPKRTPDWANLNPPRAPVALLGCDGAIPGSATAIIDAFKKSSVNGDMYTEITHHESDGEPMEAPLASAPNLTPVLHAGTFAQEDVEAKLSSKHWFKAVEAATGSLVDKGYCPIMVGGDGTELLPMLQAVKQVENEDFVVVHFGGRPELSSNLSPLRVAHEKHLVKGAVSFGNRDVDFESRQTRKAIKIKYVDAAQLFMKGIFCVRDLLNDKPVFLSIDINALDPAFAPGVENPDGGGLATRELLHLMRGVRAPRCVGAEIHGYYPELDVYRKDGVGMTTIATSKILKETLAKAYMTSSDTYDQLVQGVGMMKRQGMIKTDYPEF